MFVYHMLYYSIELCKIILLFSIVFGYRKRQSLFPHISTLILVLAVATCCTCFFDTYSKPFFYNQCIYTIFLVLAIFFIYDIHERWYHLVGRCAWCCAIIESLRGISSLIFHVPKPLLNNLLISLFSLVCLGIMFYLPWKKRPFLFTHVPNSYYFIFVTLVLFVHIYLVNAFPNLTVAAQQRPAFLILPIGLLALLTTLFSLSCLNVSWKERQEMNDTLLKMQEKHYLYLEQRNEETKKFRHDIRHHLYVLQNLLNHNQQEEAIQYISTMFDITSPDSHLVTVGHQVVDAILSQYSYECQQRDISFHIEGMLPSSFSVDNYDLCIIFSNLLQNALEASEKCEKKEIFLTIRYDENFIFIMEKNHLAKTQNTGIFFLTKTQKKDKENHGYGLMNIGESVRKYDGFMNYYVEHHQFVLTLTLPRNGNKKEF